MHKIDLGFAYLQQSKHPRTSLRCIDASARASGPEVLLMRLPPTIDDHYDGRKEEICRIQPVYTSHYSSVSHYIDSRTRHPCVARLASWPTRARCASDTAMPSTILLSKLAHSVSP